MSRIRATVEQLVSVRRGIGRLHLLGAVVVAGVALVAVILFSGSQDKASSAGPFAINGVAEVDFELPNATPSNPSLNAHCIARTNTTPRPDPTPDSIAFRASCYSQSKADVATPFPPPPYLPWISPLPLSVLTGTLSQSDGSVTLNFFSPPCAVSDNPTPTPDVGVQVTLNAFADKSSEGWDEAPATPAVASVLQDTDGTPDCDDGAKVTGDFTPTNLGLTTDSDGDGCSDYEELSTVTNMGGNRDPQNYYDFFPPGGTAASPDLIHRAADISYVVQHFFEDAFLDPPTNTIPNPDYDPDSDRSVLGPNLWNLGPGNGQVRAADISSAVKQFFQDCDDPP